MGIRVEAGDCIVEIPKLVARGIIADAIITDPPYGLEFMSVAWDSFATSKGSSLARPDWGDFGSKEHARTFAANGRIARNKAVALEKFTRQWASACFEVLKPGGYLLAFGGTRTHHRIWCAIEDAGFVIQDMTLWLYGSGFPKGRTQLKPAFEPICVAYKPGGKRELQIDECRVEANGGSPAAARRAVARRTGNAPGRPGEYGHTIVNRITPEAYCAEREGEALGRWPANVCLSSNGGEYELRDGITAEQRAELDEWLSENP